MTFVILPRVNLCPGSGPGIGPIVKFERMAIDLTNISGRHVYFFELRRTDVLSGVGNQDAAQLAFEGVHHRPPSLGDLVNSLDT